MLASLRLKVSVIVSGSLVLPPVIETSWIQPSALNPGSEQTARVGRGRPLPMPRGQPDGLIG